MDQVKLEIGQLWKSYDFGNVWEVIETYPKSNTAKVRRVQYGPDDVPQTDDERDYVWHRDCFLSMTLVSTKVDVTGSVNAPGGGSDGAYDLCGAGQDIDEFLKNLREALVHMACGGVMMYSARSGITGCHLRLAIGPAGSHENLPLL